MNVYQQTNNFCFCTLAVGKEYRNLALLLARDIEIHSPGSKLIILTDKLKDFENKANILAFKYQPQSCKIYNDKRLVIAQAISLYNSCIFVDADVRILEKVPEDINFLPGLVAHSCYSIIKHHNRQNKIKEDTKSFSLINKVSSCLEIDLEAVKFIQEFFFYVTKTSSFEEFIKQWEILAGYFELNGIYSGEGNLIGLAAAQANFPVIYDSEKKIEFFKDKLEWVKIKNNQAIFEDKLNYFEERKKVKIYPNSLIKKAFNKLNQKITFIYRLFRLRILTLKYWTLYRKLDKYEN